MDIFAAFATDSALELAGVWQQIGDSKFKIARLGNPAYVAALTKRFDEHAAALEVKGDESDKLSQKLMAEVWAETILLDWDTTVKFKGDVLGYTKQNAEMVMGVRDFRVKILEHADKLANFKAKEEEAQAGN